MSRTTFLSPSLSKSYSIVVHDKRQRDIFVFLAKDGELGTKTRVAAKEKPTCGYSGKERHNRSTCQEIHGCVDWMDRHQADKGKEVAVRGPRPASRGSPRKPLRKSAPPRRKQGLGVVGFTIWTEPARSIGSTSVVKSVVRASSGPVQNGTGTVRFGYSSARLLNKPVQL